MLTPSGTHCNDDGESDERREHKKGPMVQAQARSGRTPSPVAGRRLLSGGGRKNPGKSLARSRSFHRRECGSHHRGSAVVEGEQENTLQMRRNRSIGKQLNMPSSSHRRMGEQGTEPQMRQTHSFGRQLNSSHRRKGEQESTPQMRRNESFEKQLSSSQRRKGGQESTPQMRRNESFGEKLNLSTANSHRRSNKSPVSKRDSLPAMHDKGASETRDRNARRRANKQTARRASTACSLGTAQLNVFQTLERGLHCEKPSLEQSNLSESSDSLNPAASKGSGSSTAPIGEGSSKDALSKRHTVPGLNKPPKESRTEAVNISSDPVKLELEDGLQTRPAFGRRFSWWNLPSNSGDLGDLGEDEDDDLPPQVVPPSRRRSIIAEKEEKPKPSSSYTMSTPEQSNNKKSMITKSNDSLDSALTRDIDAESGSWRADSSGESLIQQDSMNEDLVSPLPSMPKVKMDKQLSSGTCTTESSSGSASINKIKKRSSKKCKRKSGKEGSMHSRTSKADAEKDDLDSSVRESIQASQLDRSSRSTNQVTSPSQSSASIQNSQRSVIRGSKRSGSDTKDLDDSTTGPIGISLEDHFNRSNRSFSRSSCDFSFCSRGSTTKRSSRKSMSIKQSNMDASRSSMSVSLSGDDLSVGSDFEGSDDFDFEDEDITDQPLFSGAGVFNGEDSFQILGDESRHKDTRSRMKSKTQWSGSGNSHSRSIRTNRQSHPKTELP